MSRHLISLSRLCAIKIKRGGLYKSTIISLPRTSKEEEGSLRNLHVKLVCRQVYQSDNDVNTQLYQFFDLRWKVSEKNVAEFLNSQFLWMIWFNFHGWNEQVRLEQIKNWPQREAPQLRRSCWSEFWDGRLGWFLGISSTTHTSPSPDWQTGRSSLAPVCRHTPHPFSLGIPGEIDYISISSIEHIFGEMAKES